MVNGCAGRAQADDSGADAPGTRTVVRPVAPDPRLGCSGHRRSAGAGSPHHRKMVGRLRRGRPGSPDLRAFRGFPPADKGMYGVFRQGHWVTSRLGLGSGQGSGSSQTRLQRRPLSNNHLSQSMPWRMTLTVRTGLPQGSRRLGAGVLGGVRRLPGRASAWPTGTGKPCGSLSKNASASA